MYRSKNQGQLEFPDFYLPYLQFFIGLEEFTLDRPFDSSTMVDFRKRLGAEGIQQIAEAIALASLQEAADAEESTEDDDPGPDSSSPEETTEESANQGQLIADASCAPADIRYPTDVSLLNEAREKTEEIIDELHIPLVGKQPRPHTYRIKACHRFVAFTKHKKPSHAKIRTAKKGQLGFLRRNLQAIDRLLENPQAAKWVPGSVHKTL